MRNLKRALSLALAAVMLIGMMVVGTSAAGLDDFTDADTVADREAVGVITGLNIMTGMDDGSFAPNGSFTRAQMAVVLCRLMYGSTIDASSFVDSTPVFSDMNGHWAIAWVNLAANLGLVSGVGDGKFEPDSNVSAVDAAVMIEKALGLSPTTGSWPTAFMLKANELDLFNGLGVLPYNAALTREQVCKISLNAMFVSASGERTYRVGEETFSSAADAYFYQQGLPEESRPSIVIATPEDSWAANFGLVVDDNARDEFGRSYTKYTSTNALYKDLDVTISANAASLTYTSAVTEKQLFEDLGVTGRRDGTTSAFNYYVVMDEIWLNGVQVSGSKLSTSGGVQYYEADTTTYGDNSYNTNVIVAKNDPTSIRSSGNGTVIEVYPNGTANHYVMVIVEEYAAVLSAGDIHAATPTTEAYVSITAPRVFESSRTTNYTTDEFQAGDVVLYTMADGEIASMKLADRADSVSITGYTGTVANSIYDLSKNADFAWATSDLGKAYDLYLDSCGNVICRATPGGTPAAAVTDYTYILAAEGTPPASATLSNPNGGDYTLKVRAVLGDGTVAIYDVAVSKAPTKEGAVATTEETAALNKAKENSGIAGLDFGDYYVADVIVWDASDVGSEDRIGTDDSSNSLLKTHVFGYSLKDGVLTLSAVTATSGGDLTEGDIYVNTIGAAYTTGVSINARNGKSALITSNTVFVVIGSSDNPNSAKAYTGSIATTDTGLSMANSWVVMTAAGTSAGIADIVFTTDYTKVQGNLTSSAGYAYVDASKGSVSGTSSNPVYTYTGIDENNNAVVLTREKTPATTGVWSFNEDGTLNTLQTAYATTVLENEGMIDCAGWKNLALGVQYVYAEGMEKADGNMCVVITDTAGRVTTVFVVSAPHVHVWTKAGTNKAATCTEDGSSEYYVCNVDGCPLGGTHYKTAGNGTTAGTAFNPGEEAPSATEHQSITWSVAGEDGTTIDGGSYTSGQHIGTCGDCGKVISAHDAEFEECDGTTNHSSDPATLDCKHKGDGCTITDECDVDHTQL